MSLRRPSRRAVKKSCHASRVRSMALVEARELTVLVFGLLDSLIIFTSKT